MGMGLIFWTIDISRIAILQFTAHEPFYYLRK